MMSSKINFFKRHSRQKGVESDSGKRLGTKTIHFPSKNSGCDECLPLKAFIRPKCHIGERVGASLITPIAPEKLCDVPMFGSDAM